MSPAVHEDPVHGNRHPPYEMESEFGDSKCVGKLRALVSQRISNRQNPNPFDMADVDFRNRILMERWANGSNLGASDE